VKVIFTFTDEPDISALPASRRYNSPFELPDTALQVPDFKERVLTIAQAVGQLTQAALHLTCKELDLKDYPIKRDIPEELKNKFDHSIVATIIVFTGRRPKRRQFKIYLPDITSLPKFLYQHRGKSLTRNLFGIQDNWCHTDEQRAYFKALSTITEQLLLLLNTEPDPYTARKWGWVGFQPSWVDNTLISRWRRDVKKERAQERKRQKEEERLKVRQAKLEARQAKLKEQARNRNPNDPPQTGAGRRVGAVPGIFKGVQFRSQLEIRLATELEERGVRWVYESERIGEGSYLVDFYLLDYRSWVEVKGTFEARDNYFLKEVAKILKAERGETLYVFSQRKCYLVNPSGFKELSRTEFWKRLLTPPKD
jgi:hypothetical protein